MPWPGFSPFTTQTGNGFAEAWGPRQPTWTDMPMLTGWMTRMQSALREGQQKVDVAVYRQRYWESGPIFADPGLGEHGYSYDFVDPAELDQPRSVVLLGRLDLRGPAYRALILDNQISLPLQTARRILSYTRSGLPVVVVGTAPSRTPGAYEPASEDAKLRKVIALLLAEPRVLRVPTAAAVTTDLAALGVRSAAEPSPGPTS